MKKTENNEEVNAILNKVKSEIREGVAGKKMSLNDIDRKMRTAYDEMKEAFAKEIGEMIQEEQDAQATNCPECGEPLKKTKK